MIAAGALQPLLAFLAAAGGTAAKAHWTDGPTAGYKSTGRVPVADYVGWLREVEASTALSAETFKQMAQRLRRLHFSTFTAAIKGRAASIADEIISDTTTYANPPLTTAHVPLATLDGLFATSTIRTARGLDLDISHVWIAVDLALSGRTAKGFFGESFWTESDLEPLITWAGDLGSALNEWIDAMYRIGIPSVTTADREREMVAAVSSLASKSDLLGDMDGVILARRLDSGGPYVLSAEIEQYYDGDDASATAALAKAWPTSARRFHHFVDAVSELPATGRGSTPLVVTLTRADAIDALKVIVEDAADDLRPASYSVNDMVDTIGTAIDVQRLYEHFVTFLEDGLSSGDAPWPPATW